MIWKRVTKAARSAAGSANRFVLRNGEGEPVEGIITEVIIIPKYASVRARRELFRLRQQPKKSRGMWLVELAG